MIKTWKACLAEHCLNRGNTYEYKWWHIGTTASFAYLEKCINSDRNVDGKIEVINSFIMFRSEINTMAILSRLLACSASTSLFDVHRNKCCYNKPGSSNFPVSLIYQSVQLPPTWDGRLWVKRFGPGDPPFPAALLLAPQVSLPTPNFQTSCYFLPTRLCRWLLGCLGLYPLNIILLILAPQR